MSNQTKKATAFIFARGGSKGLPGKNIKKFCGKPLIVWAIEHAKGLHTSIELLYLLIQKRLQNC